MLYSYMEQISSVVGTDGGQDHTDARAGIGGDDLTRPLYEAVPIALFACLEQQGSQLSSLLRRPGIVSFGAETVDVPNTCQSYCLHATTPL